MPHEVRRLANHLLEERDRVVRHQLVGDRTRDVRGVPVPPPFRRVDVEPLGEAPLPASISTQEVLSVGGDVGLDGQGATACVLTRDKQAVHGRRAVQVDDDAYTAGLVSAGVPEAFAPLLTSFGTATRLGKLATVTDVVEQVGGRKPTPLSALI